MDNQGRLQRSLILLSAVTMCISIMIDNSNPMEYDNLDDIYYDNYFTYYNDTNSTNFTSYETEYHNAIQRTFTLVENYCPQYVLSPENVEYESCCRPCSTEPDCHLMHSYTFCCPQARMAHFSLTTLDRALCKSAAVNRKGDYLDLWYRMVWYCVGSPQDRTWYREEFDSLGIVYSNGTLYRNKHVAECNGITEYTRWRLVVTACNYEAIKNQNHEINLVSDVLRECIVYSVPPPDFDVSHFVCQHGMVNTMDCNRTGLWETMHSRIRFLCLNGVDALVFDTDGTPYRNVYCLTCNKPSSYVMTPKTCTRAFSYDITVIDELTILATEESDEDFLQHDTLCDTSFVLDVHQNICRPLLCPEGKAPYKEKCLLLTKDNHQLFAFMLRLTPTDLITKLNPKLITDDNHKENNDRILKQMGILDKCEVQGNDIFTYWTWGNFRKDFAGFITYELRLYTSDKCNALISSSEDNIRNRMLVSFPFKAGLISIDVNIEMTIPFIFNTTVYKKENIASYAEDCVNCSSRMIIPLNCPYINLQPREMCVSYRIRNPSENTQCSNLLTSDIFKSSVVVGDELVNDRWQSVFYICAHDYNYVSASRRSLFDLPRPLFQVSSSNTVFKPFVWMAFVLIIPFV